MPELPEVEVACRSIRPLVTGQVILAAIIRTPRLRHAIDPRLATILTGKTVGEVLRRGKYLLLRCQPPDRAATARRMASAGGWLLIHLGMSGSLRWLPSAGESVAHGKHDHFDLAFATGILRLNDPRRFGALAWHDGDDVDRHPLIAPLGLEPFDEAFTGDWLRARFAARGSAVKTVLMDGHTLVGVGNIYASESLFRAGISPLRAARRIALGRCHTLAGAIRETLAEAIAAGGSSIRDYVHADGGSGCFQVDCAVYERDGESCRRCPGTIRQIRQAGRSTYYCPSCQR